MRGYLIVIVILVIILGALVWQNRSSGYGPLPLTAAQLQALEDDQLMRQIVDDLARRVLAPEIPRDRWQAFNPAARALWAVAVLEVGCQEDGLAAFIMGHADDPKFPQIADARSGCEEMGLHEAANVLAALDRRVNPDQVQVAWQNAMTTPAAKAARLAFYRAHLTELAEPFVDAR